MLLSLLFAMIFGSSGESEFITEIPNFEKEVKHYVRDGGRRDTLLMLIDEYESAINDYGKEKKKLQKKKLQLL